MAPSQVSREKRPCAARASPSGRDCRILNGEFDGRRRRYSGRRQNGFQFSRSDHRVDFRNVLTNLVAETLHQAARDHQLPGAAVGLVLGHLQDGVDRFLLGAGDERAGVDHDHVGVFGAGDQLRPRPAASMPIMTSLSTRFLGHPRLTKPTLVARGGRRVLQLQVASSSGTDKVFVGMQSIDFNTLARLAPGAQSRYQTSIGFRGFQSAAARANLNRHRQGNFAGGEMTRTLFSAAILVSLVTSDIGRERPGKNELTGIIGRTFVSDQGVNGIPAPDTHSSLREAA